MTTIEEIRAASHHSNYDIPLDAVREYGREAIVAALTEERRKKSLRGGRGLARSAAQWFRSAATSLLFGRRAQIASPGSETLSG